MTTHPQTWRRHAKASGARVPARASTTLEARTGTAGTGTADDPRGKASVDEATRHQMIACAAYYRAERRGFANGQALQDWLAAEAEIDRLLDG